MKKLLVLLLFCTAFYTHAREIVPVIYSWAASDPAANFDRAIIDEANKQQQKYTFIFDARPGGGGVVPALHTLNTPNAILATSSAFFIRPVIFPNDSYDLSAFRGLAPKCTVTALITSTRYRQWKDVPRDRPLTIGITGFGTTTHLIALQLVKQYPNLSPVPFKGTSESLVNLLNGSVDFSINFFGDIQSWTQQNYTGKNINVLGVTGSKSFEGYPTLTSQGFGADLARMSPPHQYVTSTKMSDEKFREIQQIIQQARETTRVKAAYYIDRCDPVSPVRDEQIQTMYREQIDQWHKLARDVKIN